MRGPYASLLLLCLAATADAGQLEQGADAATGLRQWVYTDGPLQLTLVQRLPDQTRGFFEARGFSTRTADQLATACTLQAIVRNQADTGARLELDRGDWRIYHDGREMTIRTKPEWMDLWPEEEVGKAARVAFEWATFPTRQAFDAGDYAWGMVPFGPQPGARFDLQLSWSIDGRQRTERIEGIECPPDIDGAAQ